ncbi:tRNA (guanine-N7-)-methyltransferase [Amaricoccus macauensis]|uniref:tRNA (guanine-N(7)-)-methyltransferase n=1 Tax=Amaricoccus macauensis TaxID=57001 RepID=A0A840SMN9_9RHOB|nr:tRNA (guanine(46)-N(7))-methyltransferase TrmB [Amaricoccus macauensis]MBB5222010.1 tRNA (guanine-N7-)-methyltransferase [Amaricoccus macauensis]
MTEEPDQGRDRPWRNLYGRRRGKRLKPNQLRALEALLPRIAVADVSSLDNPDRRPLPPLFDDGRPVWLEVGFGGGEHMVHQAAAHPEVGIIGCEPFVNGVAMALGRVEAAGVGNIRVHPGDARDLIELLPDAGVSRVFLLYPDPWPKARHVQRRFMHSDNLALLARVMAPGAELRVATDIADYADHARAVVTEAPGFVRAPRDESEPWPGWPGTRYEAKALVAGRAPQYMTFLRRN